MMSMRREDRGVSAQITLLLFLLVDAFFAHASNANYNNNGDQQHLLSPSLHRQPDAEDNATAAGCFEVFGDHKFYLYELKAEKLCYSGKKLLERAKQQHPNIRQLLGAALFMRQQLENHPSRTLDPSEATLFVLPGIIDLTKMHQPAGCRASLKTILHSISEELLASPHFQRNHGRDHLMPFLGHRHRRVILNPELHEGKKEGLKIMKTLMNHIPGRKSRGGEEVLGSSTVLKTFRHTMRNMIIAGYCSVSAMRHGHLVVKPLLPGEGTQIRDMVVPFLAPGTIDSCTVAEGTNEIVCPNGYTGEETFEAYKESRNNTVFFIGNGQRVEQPDEDVPGVGTSISKESLRKLAIYDLEGLKWPSILADTSKGKEQSPVCDFDSGTVTTGCRIKGGLPPSVALDMMSRSLLSLHIRGDDASSSRVYEAVASGTPQLFLSSRMYQDAIPFKCAVPWGELYRPIDEIAFERAPLETMEGVLGDLLGDEQGGNASSPGRLRRLWSTQREAVKDLLWHLPGSRVAHNMVEDAMRMVLSESNVGSTQ